MFYSKILKSFVITYVHGRMSASSNEQSEDEFEQQPEAVDQQASCSLVNPFPAQKKRQHQKSYPVHWKLDVVQFAKSNSNTSAAKKFGIDKHRVIDWRNQEEQLEKLAKWVLVESSLFSSLTITVSFLLLLAFTVIDGSC